MKLEAEKAEMEAERASERALRQEAFWFKAATLLSDVWKKAANLAKE